MAQLQLRRRGQFDFRNPDDWPRWKRRFNQFRVASGLTTNSEKKQVSTLLYCFGEEAESVLTSMNPTAADRDSYDSVMGKLDEFLQVRKMLFLSEPGSIAGASWREKVLNTTSWPCTSSPRIATTAASSRK